VRLRSAYPTDRIIESKEERATYTECSGVFRGGIKTRLGRTEASMHRGCPPSPFGE
jgi:hypothetical protein